MVGDAGSRVDIFDTTQFRSYVIYLERNLIITRISTTTNSVAPKVFSSLGGQET